MSKQTVPNHKLDDLRLKQKILDIVDNDPDFRIALINKMMGAAYTMPVEPLFDCDVAAKMVPMAYPAFRTQLCRSFPNEPKVYRLVGFGRARRRKRLITARVIRELRSTVFRGDKISL